MSMNIVRSFLGRNTHTKPCFSHVVTGRRGTFKESELRLPTRPTVGITQVVDVT